MLVGLTLVPALYSRNRSFHLFEDAEVRRVRRRASALRGIVRQLAGALGPAADVVVEKAGEGAELRYRVPGLHIERRATLTRSELACLRYLAGRAGVPSLHPTDEDRAWIDGALRRLAAGLRLSEIEADHVG